jgi:hypothetical protein
MLHPRLTPLGSSTPVWLASVGPYGSWGDLAYTTRWGDGACGMYEASWTMPLPADFEHPLLRRGTLVELMDGSYRVGSPLVLSEPAVGSGLEDPWSFVATGIGREVEGDNSFYAFRASDGETTAIPSEAVDKAITDGWRITGRLASVPTSAIGGSATTDELMTVGSLLNAAGDSLAKRWGVNSDNYVFLSVDPTTPTYHVTPGAAALGTTDTDYASVVKLRYTDSTTGRFTTVTSTNTQTDTRFGRRTYGVNLTAQAAMSAATAQGFADGILAKFKGRMGWTNGFTLTSNQITTAGGVPADLSVLAEDVSKGCMVRLHGIWSDLLEFTGQTWLDVVVAEAKLVDGGQTIQLNPLGMAPRDLAAVVEEITGYKDAA